MPAQKWTREQIVEQIRGWVARGIPADKLWKQDPRLCSAARHHFGSWKKALKAAGVKSTRQKWTRQSIIREIRAAHRRGVAISANLAAAARWRFGSVREAKLAAGVPARKQSPPRFRWDADKVKSEIRARHEAGGEAALRTVWKSDRALYNAAKLHLGSWREACAAAGFPAEIPRPLQTDEILRRIREDFETHGTLVRFPSREPRFYRSACYQFGSWENAIAAAGCDDCLRRRWSKRAVLQAIADRKLSGADLAKTWAEDRPLCFAAKKYFGTWQNALSEAGIKYRGRQQWTKERVIERLQAWDAKFRGEALAKTAPGLAAAARRHFGGIPAAFEAAGIPPSGNRWTKERLIAAVQDRYASGGDAGRIGFGDQQLINAAKRLYGSWEAGAKAAGLAGRVKLKTESKHYSRLQTLQALRDWRAEGRPLANVERESGALYLAARRHFGSWVAAQRAAGFQPRYQRWSQSAILEAIAERIQNGSSLSSAHPSNVNLADAARRYFGSWKTAVQEARSKDGSNMRRAS